MFGGDGYVHYLDCNDDFRAVDICQNLSNSTLYIYTIYCFNRRVSIKNFYKTLQKSFKRER